MRPLFQVCLLLLAGCRAEADWDGTFYSCAEGHICPPGYMCGADESCVMIAAQGPPDAPRSPDGATPIDAAPTIDAAPPPPDDAGVTILTATFGERPGATFQNVTADTFLNEDGPDQNNGTHDDFHVAFGGAEQLGLLRFDVSGLPPGTPIVSAELRFWTDGDAESPLDPGSRVQVYRVLEDWQEGNGEFTPGEASWIARLPGVNWTTAGCGPPGSRDPMLLGETPMAATDTEYVVAIPASVVQSWVADPGSNHGLALPGAGPAGDYGWAVTREFGTEDRRPLLSVTYQAP